ncbi:MAG: nucleotidyltransferase family protein [Acidobacteriota bacterium]
MISCVILSAGMSSRFGSPKALAPLNSENVIEHQQNILLKTEINEIIIVLGADSKQIEPFVNNSERIRTVYNKNYRSGQTSSFKAGVEKISPDSEGIMLLPVDYPFIKAETYNYICEQFITNMPMITVPTYNNKKGHPPVFNSDLKNELLSLDNSRGLNTLHHKYDKNLLFVPVRDPGVCKTFNTTEEFKNILEKSI